MQFLVPQFIDTEDKIFGPISTRQFVEIMVGMIFMYIAYKLSTIWLFAIEAVVIFGLVVVFAFIKVNGQPFHYFIVNLIQTLRRPHLKIWLKMVPDSQIFPSAPKAEKKSSYTPKAPVSSSRLTELSLVVDTGGVYRAEESEDQELNNNSNGQKSQTTN
jgi:hypothetical protein